MSDARVHLFGIRHHGPGCARSLGAALAELAPDCLLIEGPAEGEALLELVDDPALVPPVALLVYAEAQVQDAVFYPFARFSPEWVALRYGRGAGIPIRLFDLPQCHQLALAAEARKEAEAQAEESDGEGTDSEPEAPHAEPDGDPLDWLARAAGYSDGERWWDHQIEQRRDHTDLFHAIHDAMHALRDELPPRGTAAQQHREALREAWMRRQLRAALKEGFERIAVVCGAWHLSALSQLPSAKGDDALLKGLPKVKASAAWVPWSHARLASGGGYGAGVESPGWYDHLWQHADDGAGLVARWLGRAARLLRKEGLDASSAGVIESVRLADALAALRGRPLPGLAELDDALGSVLCFGDPTRLALIRRRLLLADRLGEVPESAPQAPLLRDLSAEQRRLRLKPSADERELTLDLRKPTDLERSILLRRLSLIGIAWGSGGQRGDGRGTFKEVWQLAWQPEFAVELIAASRYGNTVAEAADARARQRIDESLHLGEIAGKLQRLLHADLPEALDYALRRLAERSAVSHDLDQLMATLPPLVETQRYGDVRGTDAGRIETLLHGLAERICIGLPAACYSLDDTAAEAMVQQIDTTAHAFGQWADTERLADWQQALRQLLDQSGLHRLVAGRTTRLLLDANALDPEAAARHLSHALSPANPPLEAGQWLEGFLRGSGLLLLHDDTLWQLVDRWVRGIGDDHFTELLPLLRRVFAAFTPAERRQMGERVVAGGPSASVVMGQNEVGFEREAAEAVADTVARLLGIGG